MPTHPPYWLDHLAVAVGAVGGVLAARGKPVDLFGAVVLALVTGLGGGTVRDLALGDLPVLWVKDSNFLLTGAVVGTATFFLAQKFCVQSKGLLVADAAGLAIYTMAGAQKGALHQLQPLAIIALGVVTGVAGGMMRDVLLAEIPAVFRQEINLYATAAILGAGLFVLLAGRTDESFALGAGAALIFILRLAALRWKWALPQFQAKNV